MHQRLAAHDDARDVFRSQSESHQGHVTDMAGDSVLAVFETAAGAVRTALGGRVHADFEDQGEQAVKNHP